MRVFFEKELAPKWPKEVSHLINFIYPRNAMVCKCKDVFVVLNDKGLHTRPSTELVKCAGSFKSNITLCYQKNTVNAKSSLGILMLAASRGSKIWVEATGDDAEASVQGILALAKNRFNIKY